MHVVPALEFMGGGVVAMRHGDPARIAHVEAGAPESVAARWVDQGARSLHLVNVDAARAEDGARSDDSRRSHAAIVKIVESAGVPVTVGGGARHLLDIQKLLDLGAANVVVGSTALDHLGWLEEAARLFPRKLVLALDTVDGHVVAHGRSQDTGKGAAEVAQAVGALPLAGILYCDVGREGTLAGPNIDGIREVIESTTTPVRARGGVRSVEDLVDLRRAGVDRAVVSLALYQGTLDLPQAIAAVEERDVPVVRGHGRRFDGKPGRPGASD